MKRYFILINIINLIIFLIFGTFFESYEGILSTFVHGTYTQPAFDEWNLDWHFLLFPFYAKLNTYFPSIQIYGLILVVYNWICLTCMGLLLLRLINLFFHEENRKKVIFIMLYSILLIDNLINLSTTRIVFISMFTIFGWIEYCRITKKTISFFKCIMLCLLYTFIALLRMDAVFLSSLIYIIFLILHKRFYKLSLLPLIVGASLLFLYVLFIIPSSSIARQSYYYNEIDIIDRDNINYEKLTNSQKLEVEALQKHSIFDKEHLTLNFYNNISDACKGADRLANGLHIKYALNTLMGSAFFYLTSIHFILLSLFTGIFLIIKFKDNRKWWILHILACIFLPVFVCIYIMTPPRFLGPFYSVVGILNVLFYIKNFGWNRKIIAFISIVLFSQFFLAYRLKQVHTFQDNYFKNNITELQKIQNGNKSKSPIIIHLVDLDKFFPTNPLTRINRQNVQFLNFYYFNSYGCYIKKWQSVCKCDALSLKDKLDYMIKNGNLFIISQPEFDFLKKYISIKYNSQLIQTDINRYDESLIVCKLKYDAK